MLARHPRGIRCSLDTPVTLGKKRVTSEEDAMTETFALVLSQNMKNLDGWFDRLKSPLELATKPDPNRFRAGPALIISQDSHNEVFAVVGYLDKTSLDGQLLTFGDVQRFTIPVVTTNDQGQSSPLVLGKGYLKEFMYLAPEAAERIIAESKQLCLRQPIA
jgi:hypothetical protein